MLRNRRNNKQRTGNLLKVKILFVSVLAALIFAAVISDRSGQLASDEGNVHVDRYRDLNAIHLRYAKALGIEPIKTDAEVITEARRQMESGRLAKLKDTRYYVIDKLTHSHPYLVPEAIDLLGTIGERFHEELKRNNMGKFRFRITSVLRTRESQKRLSGSNINASSDSSHLYGTTFDISWKKVVKSNIFGKRKEIAHGPAIRILSEIIGNLKKEGHLVAITEYREACFHITLRQKVSIKPE
jgi:hypothetical protein